MANKPKHGRPTQQALMLAILEAWAGPGPQFEFVKHDKTTGVRVFRSGRYFMCVSKSRVPDGYDWQLAKRVDDNVRIWWAVIA